VLEGGEEGGAGIAHYVLLRLAGGFRKVIEGWGLEGEIGDHRVFADVVFYIHGTELAG
jgi:hypothetical protein